MSPATSYHSAPFVIPLGKFSPHASSFKQMLNDENFSHLVMSNTNLIFCEIWNRQRDKTIQLCLRKIFI
ncbi:hypothetical protein BpHYR1_051302 [Brachionus plicatilis]|uniref:Uncharacterized protein n=1 Tax=Brachionus plicatilis TaxID=10195 RepID=A0A3M7T1I2_BRAPC|nr:hypothetical protein BpHYR1_051302 [Brachionus plicatilis]